MRDRPYCKWCCCFVYLGGRVRVLVVVGGMEIIFFGGGDRVVFCGGDRGGKKRRQRESRQVCCSMGCCVVNAFAGFATTRLPPRRCRWSEKRVRVAISGMCFITFEIRHIRMSWFALRGGYRLLRKYEVRQRWRRVERWQRVKGEPGFADQT